MPRGAFVLGQLSADQDQGDRQSRDHHAAHACRDRVREPRAACHGAHRRPRTPGGLAGQAHPGPGYEFSQTYYELPATVYTSSAITPVGDLYLHGGWIPVIVGMFLLGCGVRLLDDVMDVYGNPHSVFLFLLLFPSLVKQEDDWVGMLAGIPATLLIWLFAIYLTFRKRERPPRSPSWLVQAKGPATPRAERRRAARLITIC